MNQNQIFGIIIMLVLMYLSHEGIIELSQKQIILTFILHIAILFLLSNSVLEGLTGTSNEAVQNLGSIYNSSNATLTNLQVTGTLKVGNSILMNGDATATNKIEVYQNSDGADPKMYFDKTGKFGISGTGGSYISSAGSSISGDLSVGSNLILDGTNKWILHSPDDGRKTLYVAPFGTSDWNWGLATTIDGATGRFGMASIDSSAPTSTSAWRLPFGAYIGDGRSVGIPLPATNGKLSDWGMAVNKEDWVMLAPGFGIKLWDTGQIPDYGSAGTWKAENITNNWQYYDMWGSNKMDYFSVYRV